jgi:hypothetical protein
MEAIIEEMFRRITGLSRSNLDIINHEIEMYWINTLESNDDLFGLDTTMDNEILSYEIFDILFDKNEQYKFNYDYYLEMRMFDSSILPDIQDIPLMINYFNTYFEETYGREELKYKDLDPNKIFLYYAHAYAGYNRIDNKIKEWLDENLTSDSDTETTEVPVWDNGKEEGEIVAE